MLHRVRVNLDKCSEGPSDTMLPPSSQTFSPGKNLRSALSLISSPFPHSGTTNRERDSQRVPGVHSLPRHHQQLEPTFQSSTTPPTPTRLKNIPQFQQTTYFFAPEIDRKFIDSFPHSLTHSLTSPKRHSSRHRPRFSLSLTGPTASFLKKRKRSQQQAHPPWRMNHYAQMVMVMAMVKQEQKQN